MSATIATGQYQNIQPSFEIEVEDDKDFEDAIRYSIAHIKDLHIRFSSLGALKEHEIKVETVKDVL